MQFPCRRHSMMCNGVTAVVAGSSLCVCVCVLLILFFFLALSFRKRLDASVVRYNGSSSALPHCVSRRLPSVCVVLRWWAVVHVLVDEWVVVAKC